MLVFLGVTALGGGVEMVVFRAGNSHLPCAWLDSIPLVDSWPVPGLVLGLGFGVGLLVTAYALLIFVTAGGSGACIAVLAAEHADAGVVAYELEMLVARVGQHFSTRYRTSPPQQDPAFHAGFRRADGVRVIGLVVEQAEPVRRAWQRDGCRRNPSSWGVRSGWAWR
jgi:hypothetical protein